VVCQIEINDGHPIDKRMIKKQRHGGWRRTGVYYVQRMPGVGGAEKCIKEKNDVSCIIIRSGSGHIGDALPETDRFYWILRKRSC